MSYSKYTGMPSSYSKRILLLSYLNAVHTLKISCIEHSIPPKTVSKQQKLRWKKRKFGKRQFTFILLLLAYKIEASYILWHDVWAKNTHTYVCIHKCMHVYVGFAFSQFNNWNQNFSLFLCESSFYDTKVYKKRIRSKTKLIRRDTDAKREWEQAKIHRIKIMCISEIVGITFSFDLGRYWKKKLKTHQRTATLKPKRLSYRINNCLCNVR